MTVRAVRTLPDGTAAESREGPAGTGWFGVVPDQAGRRVDMGCGVTVLVDSTGHIASVSKDKGKVTDATLFFVLRSLTFGAAR